MEMIKLVYRNFFQHVIDGKDGVTMKHPFNMLVVSVLVLGLAAVGPAADTHSLSTEVK